MRSILRSKAAIAVGVPLWAKSSAIREKLMLSFRKTASRANYSMKVKNTSFQRFAAKAGLYLTSRVSGTPESTGWF
jgi:hypothetical protein